MTDPSPTETDQHRAPNRHDDASGHDDAEVSELRKTAEVLAREAGTVAYEGRRSLSELKLDSPDIATKSSTTDLVTAYDKAAEQSIVAWLRANRPDDGIVGEEGTEVPSQTGVEWHIDPIDGTTNFVYDQPAWGCSVGVRDDSNILAGAVYIPPLDEMFSAGFAQGATLNGAPISPSSLDDLSLSLIGTGFSFQSERRRAQGTFIADLLPKVRDIRRLGSAAIDLCFVACGRLDAYFETGLNSWDMLAGTLIATEAGAIGSSFDGAPLRPAEMVMSAPGIQRALLQELSPLAGAGYR